jgi:hypothetical protein
MSRQPDMDVRLVRFLRRAGLGNAAASCLEAVRPLALVGAQLAYGAGPLFGARADWTAFGRRLEETEGVDELLAALRQEEAAP